MCDGLAVSADERRHAAERFDNAVVDELNQKLSAEKARIVSLQAQVQDVSRHAQQAETAKRTIETQFSRENQSHMHVRVIMTASCCSAGEVVLRPRGFVRIRRKPSGRP